MGGQQIDRYGPEGHVPRPKIERRSPADLFAIQKILNNKKGERSPSEVGRFAHSLAAAAALYLRMDLGRGLQAAVPGRLASLTPTPHVSVDGGFVLTDFRTAPSRHSPRFDTQTTSPSNMLNPSNISMTTTSPLTTLRTQKKTTFFRV